jgi:glycerol-3-phosphate O-acyltransferase
MKLQIDTETKIRDVQRKFTEVYPFLKVEFYKKPYSEKKVSAIKDRISPDEIISEQAKFFKAESVDINRHRTVAALEKECYEKFGIAMQVSRKTGNIWIETSKTDDRTLKEQNQLGKTMSSRQVGILSEEEFER